MKNKKLLLFIATVATLVMSSCATSSPSSSGEPVTSSTSDVITSSSSETSSSEVISSSSTEISSSESTSSEKPASSSQSESSSSEVISSSSKSESSSSEQPSSSSPSESSSSEVISSSSSSEYSSSECSSSSERSSTSEQSSSSSQSESSSSEVISSSSSRESSSSEQPPEPEYRDYIIHGKINGSSEWSNIDMEQDKRQGMEFQYYKTISLKGNDVLCFHYTGDVWYKYTDVDKISLNLVHEDKEGNIVINYDGEYTFYIGFTNEDNKHVSIVKSHDNYQYSINEGSKTSLLYEPKTDKHDDQWILSKDKFTVGTTISLFINELPLTPLTVKEGCSGKEHLQINDNSLVIMTNGNYEFVIAGGLVDASFEEVPVVYPNHIMHYKAHDSSSWVDKTMTQSQEEGKQNEYFIKDVELKQGDVFIFHYEDDIWYGYSDVQNSCLGYVEQVAESNDIKIKEDGVYTFYIGFSDEYNKHISIIKEVHYFLSINGKSGIELNQNDKGEYFVDSIALSSGDTLTFSEGKKVLEITPQKDAANIKNNVKLEGTTLKVIRNLVAAKNQGIYLDLQNKTVWVSGGEESASGYYLKIGGSKLVKLEFDQHLDSGQDQYVAKNVELSANESIVIYDATKAEPTSFNVPIENGGASLKFGVDGSGHPYCKEVGTFDFYLKLAQNNDSIYVCESPKNITRTIDVSALEIQHLNLFACVWTYSPGGNETLVLLPVVGGSVTFSETYNRMLVGQYNGELPDSVGPDFWQNVTHQTIDMNIERFKTNLIVTNEKAGIKYKAYWDYDMTLLKDAPVMKLGLVGGDNPHEANQPTMEVIRKSGEEIALAYQYKIKFSIGAPPANWAFTINDQLIFDENSFFENPNEELMKFTPEHYLSVLQNGTYFIYVKVQVGGPLVSIYISSEEETQTYTCSYSADWDIKRDGAEIFARYWKKDGSVGFSKAKSVDTVNKIIVVDMPTSIQGFQFVRCCCGTEVPNPNAQGNVPGKIYNKTNDATGVEPTKTSYSGFVWMDW